MGLEPSVSFFLTLVLYRVARSHSRNQRFFSGQKNRIASLVSVSCFGTKYEVLSSLWCRTMTGVFLGHFYLS